MASETERATRATEDPLNLRVQGARLEVRRNFFSQRVPEKWNKIPAALKNVRTAVAFKKGYRALRSGQLHTNGEE